MVVARQLPSAQVVSEVKIQTGMVVLLDVLGAGEGEERLVSLIRSLDEDFDLMESEARRSRNMAMEVLKIQNELAALIPASMLEEKELYWGYDVPSMSVFGDSIALAAPFHGFNDSLSALSFKLAHFQEDHSRIAVDEESLSALIGTVFLMHALRLPLLRSIFRGCPLRGCMSFGNFVEYKHRGGTRLLGPAVVEVAREYEAGNWIGVTTSRGLTARLKPLADLVSSQLLGTGMHYYPTVPSSEDAAFEAFVLDWPSGYFTGLEKGRKHSTTMNNDVFKEKLVTQFYDLVRQGQPGYEQLPPRALKKYQNSEQFIRWCCEQQQFKDLVVAFANARR